MATWSPILRLYTSTAFLTICVVLVGFRDYTVGADTWNYVRAFEWLSYASFESIMERFDKDVLFYVMSKALVEVLGVRGTFVTYAALLAASVVYIVYSIGGRRAYLLLALYSTLPAFYSLGTNVVRHGVAVSCLLVGTVFLVNGRLVIASLWALLALFMHASAIVYILAALVALYTTTPVLLAIAALAALASFMSVGLHHVDALLGVNIVSSLAGSRFDGYIEASTHHYRTGFRPDFLLYTTVPVVVTLASIRPAVRRLVRWAPRRDMLLKIYLGTSAVFFLSFYYPYSDRVGIYAWILIPLIIGIEEGKENRQGATTMMRAAGIASIVIANCYIMW